MAAAKPTIIQSASFQNTNELQPGFTVLDLDRIVGFDCFLTVGEIGATDKVIGVDMTGDMLVKARCNTEKGNYVNVEFAPLGKFEYLPLADASVGVISFDHFRGMEVKCSEPRCRCVEYGSYSLPF